MPTSKIQKMDDFKKIRENSEISDGYKKYMSYKKIKNDLLKLDTMSCTKKFSEIKINCGSATMIYTIF